MIKESNHNDTYMLECGKKILRMESLLKELIDSVAVVEAAIVSLSARVNHKEKKADNYFPEIKTTNIKIPEDKYFKKHPERDIFFLPPDIHKEQYYSVVNSTREMLLSFEANLDFMEKNGFTLSMSGFYDDYAHFEWIESRLMAFYQEKEDEA